MVSAAAAPETIRMEAPTCTPVGVSEAEHAETGRTAAMTLAVVNPTIDFDIGAARQLSPSLAGAA
jgi:hypothetical protein